MNIRVSIDYGVCTGCKTCLRACAYGVFEWLDDEPIVANPRICSGCLDCVNDCPVKAINVSVS